ncbi:MAG: hypothetical protein P8I94_01735, partial [Emcibacteraceae bacterium]|nr:hypothetical protein [Emcibacteraceae bacterium]
MDYLKHSLSAPFRVGKSYFGLMIFGVLMAIFAIAGSYVIGFIGNGFSMEPDNYEDVNSLLYNITSNVFSFYYSIFDDLFLAMIVFVVWKIDELKYVLPSDIVQGFKK